MSQTSKIELDESQESALAMMLREPFCIVTGGPGTGKTTILREALRRMENRSVALCAPTGKAAKRMSETTGVEAKTIHRLLMWSPEEGRFWYGESDKLPNDVVIVDEASMVDTELLSHLCQAIDPRRTRLILVGDANQLPSVGPGAILADLVSDCDPVPVARLTRVHRSAAESWICKNAGRILAGEQFPLTPCDDFRFIEVNDAANVPKFCGDEMERNPYIQFLAPQRNGAAGIDALNTYLQERFNPLRPDELEWGKTTKLRTRDRVLHTENDYDLGVFNGEVGEIAQIEKDAMHVKYADRQYPVVYSKAQSQSLQLAYALTIHKSQGSEWPWIGCVVHSTNTFMLTRQLLYTAITRAKEGLVIVGNKKGIEAALKAKRSDARNTALRDRILGRL
jgi:exodeoxyribonuclease V alpha subunit